MGQYVYAEQKPVFAGLDSQDIVALGELGMLSGQDRQDYLSLKGMDRQDYLGLGRLPRVLPNPAFVALGQSGSDVAAVATVGIGVMVVAVAVNLALLVGASYLGARWAGCRRQA